jgi:hypothetical protein
MQELATLASIVAALSVGVISPGPSFVMVARVAVASSRIRALATALGMGAGGAIFGTAALLGLQSVLLAVPALYAALRVLGGLYLCYLGFLIFRSARQPLVAIADSGKGSKPAPWRVLAGPHNTAEQPEGSHHLCQRVRRLSPRVLLAGVRCRAACSRASRRDGLVCAGRPPLLFVRPATGLSVVQGLDRSSGRCCHVRSRPEARDERCQTVSASRSWRRSRLRRRPIDGSPAAQPPADRGLADRRSDGTGRNSGSRRVWRRKPARRR